MNRSWGYWNRINAFVSIFSSHDRPDPYLWLKLEEADQHIQKESKTFQDFLGAHQSALDSLWGCWKLRRELRESNQQLHQIAGHMIERKTVRMAMSLVERGRSQSVSESMAKLLFPPVLHTEIVTDATGQKIWLETRQMMARRQPIPMGFSIHHFDLLALGLTNHIPDLLAGGPHLSNCFLLTHQDPICVESCPTQRTPCNNDHALLYA
jgi:hypothetical protein